MKPRHQRRAIGYRKFLENMVEMRADGPIADLQCSGDGAVRQAARDASSDLLLPDRQLRKSMRCRGDAPVGHLAGRVQQYRCNSPNNSISRDPIGVRPGLARIGSRRHSHRRHKGGDRYLQWSGGPAGIRGSTACARAHPGGSPNRSASAPGPWAVAKAWRDRVTALQFLDIGPRHVHSAADARGIFVAVT